MHFTVFHIRARAYMPLHTCVSGLLGHSILKGHTVDRETETVMGRICLGLGVLRLSGDFATAYLHTPSRKKLFTTKYM